MVATSVPTAARGWWVPGQGILQGAGASGALALALCLALLGGSRQRYPADISDGG